VTLGIGAIVLVVADTIHTRRRSVRTGGFATRDAIRTAIAVGHLPPDADPETWTSPLVDRLRTVCNGPWALAGLIAAVVVIVALAPAQHLGDPVVAVSLTLELALSVIVFAVALRDRVGPRAHVLTDLLSELDARAALDTSVNTPSAAG
jgi:hypothetical protein